MKYPEHCKKIISYPIIVLEEEGRKITFKNNNENIRKVRVDDCAIEDGIRCDWLLIRSDNKEFFVELKGKNLEHAFKQIEKSIEKISDNPKKGNKNIYIVISRSPIKSSQIQFKEEYFRKKYNAKKLLIREIMPEIDIQTA
jgi:hypothetical protein